ncbi:hypothetical protein BGW39_004176, partial [Mortierella sp. 14UC]
YTALNLTLDAKSWWRSSGLTGSSTWADFKKEFLKFHTPPNAVAAAREGLESLRQGKRTVAAYTHDFRRLHRRVTGLDTGTALHWFMKGLERDTSKEVRLRQPQSLDEAISVATMIHALLYPEGPTNASVSPSTPAPMDIDTLLVTLHNLQTQVNSFQKQNGSATSYPPKITQKEKEFLKAKGGCFKCRKLGHMSKQCRTFPDQPRANQSYHVNNVETSGDTAPQQASLQPQAGKALSN